MIRYFLTFFDKEKFTKFDMEKHEDISKQIQYTRSYPIMDIDKILRDHEDPTIVERRTNSEQNKQSGKRSKSEKGYSNSGGPSVGEGNRTIKPKQEGKTGGTGGPEGQNIIVPPDKGESQKRITVAQEVMMKKLDKLDQFTVNNCGFDWLQFGMLYSLFTTTKNNYLHTPIAIANVLKRDEPKTNVLSHLCKFLTIKFKP